MEHKLTLFGSLGPIDQRQIHLAMSLLIYNTLSHAFRYSSCKTVASRRSRSIKSFFGNYEKSLGLS